MNMKPSDQFAIDDDQVSKIRERLQTEPVEVRIASDSMLPILKVGQRCLLVGTSIQDLTKFDIIVFQRGRFLIAHYVWHINRHIEMGTIVTRSLNPGYEDLPISPENVLGRLKERIPSWLRFRLILGALFGR